MFFCFVFLYDQLYLTLVTPTVDEVKVELHPHNNSDSQTDSELGARSSEDSDSFEKIEI